MNTKSSAGLWLKKGEMVTTSEMKTKFSQLNDKRFFFPTDILSLPHGHSSLTEINNFKHGKRQEMENYFWEEKEKLPDMEKRHFEIYQDLEYLTKF